MSYDLHMLEPRPGEDPVETLERLAAEEGSAAPEPAILERNRRMADSLLALNPAYSEFEFKYEAIAEQSGISVEEARARYRHIELMDEGGLQVILYDHHASINFPYWESLDPAKLLREIAGAAGVIADQTGWQLYDPQLEKFLDPARDAGEFAEMFAAGVAHVRRIAAEQEGDTSGAGRPSRWRRLFGRG
jgi:hypothetical protein